MTIGVVKTSEKFLRQFHNKTFKINKVYNDYRTGCIDLGNDKYLFRTFKWFGKAEDQVLRGGSDRIKEFTKEYEVANGRELREVIWDGNTPTYMKVKDKLDKDFWKTWGKVFDIEIEFEKELNVTRYYDKKNNVDVTESGDVVNVTWVKAWKIKSMLRGVMDEDKGELIPLVEGKDKAGNEAMVEAYDWEDTLKNVLEGKFVKMKVSGEGMDTKYMFQEGKEFVKETKKEVDDEPFGIEDGIPF